MLQIIKRWFLAPFCIFLASCPFGITFANSQKPDTDKIEEIIVWGSRSPFSKNNTHPVSRITPADLESVNAMTTEDLIKFEPSLVIRQRYIGDSNGTMGIRGSNMFQTARSMVFADGVPLHYFLQTRWNGSPRWSLVSADEIAEINISYGPFSAEYSGNSMGGVVNIETAIPTSRKFHAQFSGFQQNFDSLGYDENLGGYKSFLSYGDKIGAFSIYASFNRLINDSHPQSFYFSKARSLPTGEGINLVSGGVLDVNEYNDAALYYGNAGSTEINADQFKLKVGYETNNWLTIVNVAFEDRKSDSKSAENYLVNASGQPVWNGWVQQDEMQLEIESDDFSNRKQERQSLILGGRSRGQLSERSHLEIGASYFSVLKDKSYATNASPADPDYIPGYDLTQEYGDTGWSTFDIKLLVEDLWNREGLSLTTGYHFDFYELDIEGSSGGKSSTQALFGQLSYAFSDAWLVNLGGRFEDWQSEDGYYIKRDVTQYHPDRSESRFSPKFALSYLRGNWQFTYSFAGAYRFPIVEELFQNERTAYAISIANASLEPEAGLHHNIALERNLENGYVRFNIYNETIEDVIFSQTGIIGGTSLRTFLPVSEVTTNGAELDVNLRNLFDTNIEMRFNIGYLETRITENDPNPSLEGNDFPRMPRWRANMLLTWHITDQWNLGGGVRYASNNYGDLDNSDTAESVYGAHDEYLFINLKTNYRVNDSVNLSLGLDNVTNEIAYVHHPWPGRTLFLEASLDF